MTPEELICDLSEFYGYEVDLSYAINYIDMVGEDYVEVDSFHLWIKYESRRKLVFLLQFFCIHIIFYK